MEDELATLSTRKRTSYVKMLIPLYLVILSFFILISIVVSKDVTESSVAMTLINRSFGVRPLHFFNSTQLGVGVEGSKLGVHEDKVWAEIIDLISHKLGVPTLYMKQKDSQIDIEVSGDKVFGDYNHRSSSPAFEGFWQDLSNLLRSYDLMERFEIEFEYGFKDVGSYQSATSRDRAQIDFMANLFAKLDSLAFVPSNLKASFAHADTDNVRISFAIR